MTGKTLTVKFSVGQLLQVVKAVQGERDRYRGWSKDMDMPEDLQKSAKDAANRLDVVQAYLLGCITAEGIDLPDPVDAEAGDAD